MVMIVIEMALIGVLIDMIHVMTGDVNVTRAIHVTSVTVATLTITGAMAVGVGEVDTVTVMDVMANPLKNVVEAIVEAITTTIESKSVILTFNGQIFDQFLVDIMIFAFQFDFTISPLG